MEQVIDLNPLIQGLGSLLVAILVAVAFFAINLVREKVGLAKLESDQVVRDYLDKAIKMAINYALTKLGLDPTGKIVLDSSNQSAIIASATNYLLSSVPDALARFAITPERVRDMVTARLTEAVKGGTYAGLVVSTTEVSGHLSDGNREAS